jgi:peptidoglycan/LPS O-acetylase OafA/YrhL
MNKNSSNAIKGLTSIAIVLHHIKYQNILFAGFGYMGVGIFFFLSGYNLSFCNHNKENYTKDFIFKKFFLLFLPFYFWNTVYLLFLDEKIGLRTFICIFDPTYFCHYAWYVKRLIYIFIIYYVLSIIKKNNKWKNEIALGILVLVISGILFIPAEKNPNHIFPLAFLIGWIIGQLKDEKRIKLGDNNLIFFGAFLGFILSTIRVYHPDIYVTQYVLAFYFSPALLGLVTFFICAKTNETNKALLFLGNISYSIYLIHPCFLRIGDNIDNMLIYLVVVFGGTITVSVISTYLFNQLFFFAKNRFYENPVLN